MNNITWNAKEYGKNFSFVAHYGEALLDLIEGNNLSVLDLGCGNGTLTEMLAQREYKAVGMDLSDSLLAVARQNHPELEFMKGDATNFTVPEPFDVVFSNAVFHWIDKEKQSAMMGCVCKALKPKGQFIFEMGGYGNNVLIHGVLKKEFEKRGYTYKFPFYFPSIGEYATLLEQAGFLVRSALLFDRFTPLKGDNGLNDWIHMFVNNPFIGMNEKDHEDIITAAVEKLKPDLYVNGNWYSDYVRLRVKAEKR